MTEPLKDAEARRRFREEWQNNFAVSANAGSGKTTAISERLASMALSADGGQVLAKTAVVTYTKKAAAQIGQKARQVLLRRLESEKRADLSPLDQLERAFFGTIHSFCLLLAQRYGQPHGLNLNPRLLEENEEGEDVFWEEFIEQDVMSFSSLTASETGVFLRFVELKEVFAVARELNAASAKELARRRPRGPLPKPDEAALARLLALPAKGNEAAKKTLARNQRAAAVWQQRYQSGRGFLGLFEASGSAKAVVENAEAWMAPLETWLTEAASVLAAELAERYREYRRQRGVQTYADQIDTALAVLHDTETLEKIRADGWRVVLDEAQDTDSQQFAVLVEIARPVGARTGSWPEGGGVPPRAGHFCLVGDGQQAIYRARADIRNFLRHLKAFERGDGGELLVFQVTFRAPGQVVSLLNAGLPDAFGPGRPHNLGLAPAEGVSAPQLQVPYVPLETGPGNPAGRVERFPLVVPAERPEGVDAWQAEEARQLAAFLRQGGPGAVGAERWSEVCVLAPRNEWLKTARDVFEKAGLKTALQIRRNRSGDNPAYAWLAGLLAVVCNPEDAYEWFGVLREIFAVSDALLATERRAKGGYLWDDPEQHPEPLRAALATVRPWILRVDDEGQPLSVFSEGLAEACRLREKADAIDPSGGVREELNRLLAEAAALGQEGAGPRAWARQLIAGLETKRAGGRAQDDAINLLSSHSAKGLEWPVVIVLGLWRPIGEKKEPGLCLITDPGSGGGQRLYLSLSQVPEDTAASRERERLRELVRLLYVTLTRAKQRLILSWQVDFGSARKSAPSFVELWGAPALLEALPETGTAPAETPASRKTVLAPKDGDAWVLSPEQAAAASYPRRLLPHQLAEKEDKVRGARHETSLDQAAPVRLADGDEAIDYGVWWHETMEFTPWLEAEAQIDARWAQRLEEAAAHGFRARAEAELLRFKTSAAWAELRSRRWALSPELAVFSPLENGEWIDGVIDLLMRDEAGKQLWIVDWKTNRRRSMEGEEPFKQRLAQEYAPQLRAYGACLNRILPGWPVRLLVFSSSEGVWFDV